MITAILGTAAAIGLIAAWIFFDSGIWLMEISPKNKKDKKFKDKRLGEQLGGQEGDDGGN